MLRVRPEYGDSYIEYHKAVWPDVLALIRDCQIRNYSIFLKDHTLFAYFEYHGADFEAGRTRRTGGINFMARVFGQCNDVGIAQFFGLQPET